MIEIFTIPDQACSFTSIPAGIPTAYVGADNGPTVTIPPLIVQASPGNRSLTSYSEYVTFGYIKQGDQSYGTMRDHDVHHLGAHGRIVMNNTISAIVPAPRRYPNQPIFGWQATLGNYSSVASAIVEIGEDYDTTLTYSLPSYQRNGDGVAIFPDDAVISLRLRWSESKLLFVLEHQIAPCIQRYASGAEWTTIPGTSACRFGEFYPNSNACEYTQGYSVRFGGTDPPIVGYIFPRGKTGLPMSLLPAPTLYSVDSGGYAFVNLTYVVGSGIVYVTSAAIISMLQSTYLIKQVATAFGSAPMSFDMGELTADIIRSQKHVDANLLLTAFDLLRLREDITSWKTIYRNLDRLSGKITNGIIRTWKSLTFNLEHLGKDVSSGYLGTVYGILPTMRDGQRVMEGLAELATWPTTPSRTHARRTSTTERSSGPWISNVHTMTVETDALPLGFGGDVMARIRDAKNWGVWPDFNALWDFVPYSFVFDWFSDSISDRVEFMDLAVDCLYFPVNYCIMSNKRSFSPLVSWIFPPEWGLMGRIVFTEYDRYMTRELPLPSIQTGDGISNQFTNWGEALALIIQRKKG